MCNLIMRCLIDVLLQVPTNWLRYTVPKDVTVMDWVVDFSERVKQLIRIGASQNLKVSPWMQMVVGGIGLAL